MIKEAHEIKRFLVKRAQNSGMSQIMTGSHRPVPNMRQKVTMRARGGDRRTVLQNRVSQFRKARDNDRIIRDRPLG